MSDRPPGTSPASDSANGFTTTTLGNAGTTAGSAKATSPDQPSRAATTSPVKDTSGPPSVTNGNGTVPNASSPGLGTTRSTIPAFSTSKTLYSAPYDTPGMRMSVSAVLAGSGRDSTFYRGVSFSPSPRPATTATTSQQHPISPPASSSSLSSLPPPPNYDKSSMLKDDKALTNEQLVRALTSVPLSGSAGGGGNTNKASSSPTSLSSSSATTDAKSQKIGNALAAVAATVAQRTPVPSSSSSSLSSSSLAIPSTTTPAPTTGGSSVAGAGGNQKSSNSNSTPPTATAAAVTAIGNLAANISTLLQATTATNGNQQQQQQQHHHSPQAHHHQQSSTTERRRSSALQLTQMLDQAILLGVQNNSNKSPVQDTVTGQGHAYDASPLKLKGKPSGSKEEKAKEEIKRLQRTVRSDKTWEKLQGLTERRLGSYLYSPGMLLPINESQLNGLVEVVIPARYLTYENPQVKRKAVWGTDIYTDDSDIVPIFKGLWDYTKALNQTFIVIVHSGKYEMTFVEPDIDPRDPFFLALGAGAADVMMQGDYYKRNGNKRLRPGETRDDVVPDHDLKVTLRVMPTLKRYTGTIRHYIASRTWSGNHDGASYWVEQVEKIQLDQEEEEPASPAPSAFKRSKSKPKKKVRVVSPPPRPAAAAVAEQPASPAPYTTSRRRARRTAAKVG
ncbi:histone deacetylation protein Rxt3-domain-containing protein [Zychaea mexicana]|uniref:histone deacetylation protein Rxt3-domain-containing protein n=1 Tax=Zychaea mexicana TaxID=64656 RepID=UPI0022FDF3EB|nr:histone deacetylation protein Rxt3-domain-containing protein [Zychaea mexicana]KAI9489162.1 histone deacetylation protein Rxt3-domain-containing protein [Zychaea mexicana]